MYSAASVLIPFFKTVVVIPAMSVAAMPNWSYADLQKFAEHLCNTTAVFYQEGTRLFYCFCGYGLILLCPFSTGRAAPVFLTTCCPGWSSTLITWRTLWRSEHKPTWRRKEKLKTSSIKFYHSKKKKKSLSQPRFLSFQKKLQLT